MRSARRFRILHGESLVIIEPNRGVPAAETFLDYDLFVTTQDVIDKNRAVSKAIVTDLL